MLAATSLFISMSTALFADTRLSIQHTEPGKQPQIQTVMVTSGKVRMEQGTNDDALLLYHQADNSFYAIQPNDKQSRTRLSPELYAPKISNALLQISPRHNQIFISRVMDSQGLKRLDRYVECPIHVCGSTAVCGVNASAGNRVL